ncbi:MAG: Rho termination factor N-terminal domain-containing protein [Campylobacterota bacterium]|nr:Rho termination factor N-terminal domain-containing protein [Campylobacterota bacterium]
MFIKNESKRVISFRLKKRRVKIIPTRTVSITDSEKKEIENNKVVLAWFKDKDLVEVTEKATLTSELVMYSSTEELSENYGIRELQAYAKENGIEGYSNLDKDALIELLKNSEED